MWVPMLTAMGISVLYFYKDKVLSVGRKISFLTNLLFEHAVYNLADQYGLVSGEKKIAENLNMAKVSYRNLRGEICILHVPFLKENVRVMKDKIVILEREGKNGMVYENITQEPGMPYLLSPFEMGGRKITVYQTELGWNTKSFRLSGNPVMVVTKHEKLPLRFNFEKKEIEVEF